MGKVIAFLRSETEKKEHLFEDLFSIGNEGADIDEKKLIALLQNSYILFSRVEGVRENYQEWTLISSNRVYDVMKAIIGFGCLPLPLCDMASIQLKNKATACGFLYVVHLFQIYSHALGHELREDGRYGEMVCRVFSKSNEDLRNRSAFLDKVRGNICLNDKADLKQGIEIAFDEIERLLNISQV